MRLENVFVMCDDGGPEAQELAALGLVEGSPNTHPGQGTACRRFFFEDVYLELLWVAARPAVQSPDVARTRLWERWAGRRHTSSPFGLVFRADPGEVSFPWPTWAYRPPWLGGGLSIAFPEDSPLSEPAIIVLPPMMRDSQAPSRPANHRLSLGTLDGVSCGCAGVGDLSAAARALTRSGVVTIIESSSPRLQLTFAGGGDGIADLRPTLPIVLAW